MLLKAEPSAVIELNRAAAIAMRDGPGPGLGLIDKILASGELMDYYRLTLQEASYIAGWDESATRAKLTGGLGAVTQEPERRFLDRRLVELDSRR